MDNLKRLAEIRDELQRNLKIILKGKCKARDLLPTLRKAWQDHEINEHLKVKEYQFDYANFLRRLQPEQEHQLVFKQELANWRMLPFFELDLTDKEVWGMN